MDELDKIEEIVSKTEAGYEQAVKELRTADGDVEAAVAAINDINENRQISNRQTKEEFEVKGDQLKEKIKELIKQSSVTRLKIKQEDRTLLDIPVAAGVIGTIVSPYLAAVGALAAMVTKCSIEVERAAEQVGPGIIDKQQKI